MIQSIETYSTKIPEACVNCKHIICGIKSFPPVVHAEEFLVKTNKELADVPVNVILVCTNFIPALAEEI